MRTRPCYLLEMIFYLQGKPPEISQKPWGLSLIQSFERGDTLRITDTVAIFNMVAIFNTLPTPPFQNQHCTFLCSSCHTSTSSASRTFGPLQFQLELPQHQLPGNLETVHILFLNKTLDPSISFCLIPSILQSFLSYFGFLLSIYP